jgi:hypothetical protein
VKIVSVLRLQAADRNRYLSFDGTAKRCGDVCICER